MATPLQMPNTPNLPGLGGAPVKSTVPLTQGSMSSLLSMGVKPKIPGGINTTAQVGIKPADTAPASQQKAGGPTGTMTNLMQTPNYAPGGHAIVPPASPSTPTQPNQLERSNQTNIPTPMTAFPSIIGAQTGAGQQAISAGQQQQKQAYDLAQQYQQQLEAQQEQEAKALGAIGTSPIPIEFQQGRASVVQGQEAAIQAAQAAALQGESALAQGGTNLQQAGIGALGSAAGQVAPSGAFPFVFNPTTGQFTSPGGGQIGGGMSLTYNPQQDATTLAKAVIDLKIPYTDALNAMGYAGNVGTGLLQTAITAQGGNLTNIEAQQSAIQSNIQTTGTAGTQAANTAYQSAVQNVANATRQYNSLTGISGQLNNTLATWTNSGKLTNVNQALNTVAGLTSDPNYQQFVVALGNTQAAYQSILGSAGVTPTKADTDALNALSPNSSAQAINAALNQLSKDAHALLVVPAYQQQSQYAGQLGIGQ